MPRNCIALTVLLLALFMELVDVSSANLALPSIQSDIGASPSELQWVMAAYSIAFAMALLPGGHLGDVWGRRRAFMAGVVLFGMASMACGFVDTPLALIVSRLAQGLGGGVMMPQVLASTREMFDGPARSRAFGIYGAVVGLGMVLGPFVGGYLVDANVFGLVWRPVFLINVPVAIIAFFGSWKFVPNTRHAQNARTNLKRLFRRRRFTAGLGVALVTYTTVAGFFLTASVFVQSGLSYSPLKAALVGIPFSVGAAASSVIAGLLLPRFQRKVLFVGASIYALGMGSLAVVVDHGFTVERSLAPLVLAGAGMAAVVVPLLDFTLSDVHDDDVGLGSGLLNLMQPLGGAGGVWILGSVFFGRLDAGTSYPKAFISVAFIVVGSIGLASALMTKLPPRSIPRAVTPGS